MADLPKSKTSSAAAAAASGNAWLEQFTGLFAFNEQAFASWARGVSAVAEEMGRFTQARWHEDAEIWQVLAACRNPLDAIECQRRYAEKAAGQYMEEANKLTQLVMDATNESFTSLQKKNGGMMHAA